MPLFDCDELLGKLKVRGQVPVSAGTWTAAALFEAMSDEAETWLMPMLIKAKGEYLVKVQDVPFVVGQADYRWTTRACAVREVSRLMADGTEVPLEEWTPPTKTGMGLVQTTQGSPRYYTFKDGAITLYPVPNNTTDSLRVKYHYRLNRMVSAADCLIITAITPAGGSGGSTRLAIALLSTSAGTLPAAFVTWAGVTGAQRIDFIRPEPPFDVLAFDVTPVGGLTAGVAYIDVTAAQLPTGLAVGDVIAGQRRTPFPNMPPELHVCAALRAASAAVKSKGDKALAAALLEEAEGKETSLLTGILAPRSKGNTQRLVQRRFR